MKTAVVIGAGVAGPVAAMALQKAGIQAEVFEAHPTGADYVIVPAMSRDDDPAAIEWLRDQSKKGAMIVGVCAGAKVDSPI